MVRISLPNRLKSYNSTSNSRSVSPIPSMHRKASDSSMNPDAAAKGNGLMLKVVVLKARNLAAKDKNGTSDPYLVLTVGDSKNATHSIPKTLDPEWNVTIQAPVTGVNCLLLDCVCWDKDRFGKDYLGEFDLALEDIFANTRCEQEPTWYALKSKRKGGKKDSNVSGEVQLQFTLFDSTNHAATPQEVMAKFRALISSDENAIPSGRPTLRRTNTGNTLGEGDEDDELDDDEDTSDETDDPTKPQSAEKRKRRLRIKGLKKKKQLGSYEFSGGSDVVGIVFLEIGKITDLPPERNMTRTSFDMDPFVVASLGKKTYRTRVVRHNLNPVFNEKMIFQVLRHEQNYSMSFTVVDRDKLSGNDFVASTSLNLKDVTDTAPVASPDTGLYAMKDPPEHGAFTAEKNRSRFKIPLSRTNSAQSLNKMNRPALTPQRSSNNVLSSSPGTPVIAPTSNPGGLQPGDQVPPVNAVDDDEGFTESGDPDLHPFTVPLKLKNYEKWEEKHSPVLFLKAKYVPYTALRQQFWRSMLKQYDTDESGRISKVELTTMLDTLGSTLKESTIDGFFKRFPHMSNNPEDLTGDLSVDEVVICLEDQLQKKQPQQTMGDKVMGLMPDANTMKNLLPPQLGGTGSSPYGSSNPTVPNDSSSSSENATLNDLSQLSVEQQSVEELNTPGEEGDYLGKDDLNDKGEEHVVEIRECPICHQPRLNKRSDADIITHIATCASQDWRQVNNIVMAGFVTSSQAQRKWYSKVITKISYGGYKLGANSANILVQDRITGQINEERMSVYVRLGIRLLYKGLKSRDMEKKRIRKLLRGLSFKQGVKYDDPASAAEIQKFVAFHQLDMSEVLLPMEQFKNFNEFFYRALKPDARPCSAPDNPRIIVSPADCRSVVFNKMDIAKSIWVKGREFSVERLLGNAYPEDAKRYTNGALGIFRLAPQDYHRFHIPVDGVMGEPKLIEGEYYTVNPMAIRSALDVYGENVRVVIPIDSVAHGRVMVICIGAMMVGSTVITRKTGENVKRAEELGYFKFGGSTILVLFEENRMKFDDDLVDNSNGALETLIRVGMSIGHHPQQGQHTPDMRKKDEDVTESEKAEAKRRIEGSIEAGDSSNSKSHTGASSAAPQMASMAG
ncbi:phosphatidylserine decarboxylase [Phlyctema vagabunda]|uniref:Phosphatidylserine decarboxylase proenzyme 2 n=1 Tax=Phlyctema vagabunda TaxID=108571 RepID=A0ABR4PI08_9HELO